MTFSSVRPNVLPLAAISAVAVGAVSIGVLPRWAARIGCTGERQSVYGHMSNAFVDGLRSAPHRSHLDLTFTSQEMP